mmetsp:Transcript_41708/g.88884  ORF Transcript_41708/g.88884 Transcript_41708/m.88884 type:complete len:207 (+) Transcript_41708:62-682(+)
MFRYLLYVQLAVGCCGLTYASRSHADTDNSTIAVVVPKNCLIAAAVGSGAVVAVGVPAALTAAGFGAGGVTSGSLATAWQSSFGAAGIAKGSLFATLQSVSMGGLGASQGILMTGALATGFSAFCSQLDQLGNASSSFATTAARWISNMSVAAKDKIYQVLPHIENATSDVANGMVGAVQEEAPKVAHWTSEAASHVADWFKSVLR